MRVLDEKSSSSQPQFRQTWQSCAIGLFQFMSKGSTTEVNTIGGAIHFGDAAGLHGPAARAGRSCRRRPGPVRLARQGDGSVVADHQHMFDIGFHEPLADRAEPESRVERSMADLGVHAVARIAALPSDRY